jgi:cation diffusion facilitator CzcD-associated flavoprotein CzcO
MPRSTATQPDLADAGLPAHSNIAIVGTGFSGLGTAIRLARAGRRDFVVLERGDDVGGTWRDNTYPGAACDVPSRLYSFSFRLNPDWSRSYSPQPEILDYLRECAREAGIWPHLRLRTELLDATWDESAGRWCIETSRGKLTANFLVLGTGALVEPARPDIAGLDSFTGKVFHSARWDHDHELTGRRVGVIGTGASAIQFVPHVVRQAAAVSVFQRTAPWIVPRPDRPVHAIEKAVYRYVPAVHRIARAGVYTLLESRALGFVAHPKLLAPVERIARVHLHRAVADPQLREKLTPDYNIGCKRILVSNDYYPAVAAEHVDLVTTGIERIEAAGVRTTDGVLHEVDTLILGTGFRVTDNPGFARIRGRGGRTLEEAWASEGMRAHLGTTVPGFPNLFLLLGPNTGIGHTSAVYMIESQIGLVVAALDHLRRHQLTELEVRPEVEDAYNTTLVARSRRSVWKSGCRSWYLDEAGRNTVLWPDLTFRFRAATRRFRPEDYLLGRRAEVPAAAALGPGDTVGAGVG